MRVDEKTVERVAETVEGLEKLLITSRDAYVEREVMGSKIRSLAEENSRLAATIASAEHKSRVERGRELDIREKAMTDENKLHYNKGYADAYTEVTGKMRT